MKKEKLVAEMNNNEENSDMVMAKRKKEKLGKRDPRIFLDVPFFFHTRQGDPSALPFFWLHCAAQKQLQIYQKIFALLFYRLSLLWLCIKVED